MCAARSLRSSHAASSNTVVDYAEAHQDQLRNDMKVHQLFYLQPLTESLA